MHQFSLDYRRHTYAHTLPYGYHEQILEPIYEMSENVSALHVSIGTKSHIYARYDGALLPSLPRALSHPVLQSCARKPDTTNHRYPPRSTHQAVHTKAPRYIFTLTLLVSRFHWSHTQTLSRA